MAVSLAAPTYLPLSRYARLLAARTLIAASVWASRTRAIRHYTLFPFQNTARRVQRFVEAFKPKFRGLFGVQADAAAAARKRAAQDEQDRAQQASAAASDLDDLAVNQADAEAGAEAAPAKASSRVSSRASVVGRPAGAFKSVTGLEPFDFDFAALDKLVQSGDKSQRLVPVKTRCSNTTSSRFASSPCAPLDLQPNGVLLQVAAVDVDLPGAVSQASDILSGSLKRVAVSR